MTKSIPHSKLYDYLEQNIYILNSKDIMVYNNPLRYYYKSPIVIVIYNNNNIMIKNIEANRRFYFESSQNDAIIVNFLNQL